MNVTVYGAVWSRNAYRALLWLRTLGGQTTWRSFGRATQANSPMIEQIYVINLDRETARWEQMQRELGSIVDRSGRRLSEAARRFSAIDASRFDGTPDASELDPGYLLGDQLFVDPEPALERGRFDGNMRIQMSRQEIAVGMSHIEVWKLIACGDADYVLVLEDDVYFRAGFERRADRAWAELHDGGIKARDVDILYLSFKEAKTKAERRDDSGHVFRPVRGLWQLSGYVLSRAGARRLLKLLPVRGPVDLWVNLQFDKLEVFATSSSVIDQRRDVSSGNSYSILPVLSGLGVLTREKPKKYGGRRVSGPVFAWGESETGLTSLAMAISMLGYRCCSDVVRLPGPEYRRLFERRRRRVFEAYINVVSLIESWKVLAELYPDSKFIVTVGSAGSPAQGAANGGGLAGAVATVGVSRLIDKLSRVVGRVLVLSVEDDDKWQRLCDFLQCERPTSDYPRLEDIGARRLADDDRVVVGSELPTRRKKWDRLPWIVNPVPDWGGMVLDGAENDLSVGGWEAEFRERFDQLEGSRWELLDDTFPDNLALFRKENVSLGKRGCAALELREGGSQIRDFTSASIGTSKAHRYGRFEAEIRPARGPGLVTGMFLHRNSPRQEIDIEFLGKDTRQLMVNVYYNPGGEGATFEYGYRGTPTVIDLGFDAAETFHRYAMAWTPKSIRWYVDGRLVHERGNWDPTPIPHLPMRFFLNLWPPRSKALAGVLSARDLPAASEVRSVDIDGWR